MSHDSNRSKVPQPKRIDELLKEYGFRPDAPVSTGRALIVNLVRSAYGHEAAREFIRQMNLSENQDVKLPSKENEFQNSSVTSVEKSVRNSRQSTDFPIDYPTVPQQLRLFDDTGTD
ncbi:MAG: hypothetical protein J0L82_02325 [Deltaproteobacteria bacterium]|nr:hypothetical protein [Deltaproteobacteria bacterium]